MMTNQKHKKLGDLLFLQLSIRHEEAMAQLYDVLKHQVPASKTLWSDLCREELSHANRLETLMKEVKAGNAYLDEARHSADCIKVSLDSILPRVKTWASWGVKKSDAYEYAMLMEGSMIERRYFVPSPDDSAFTQQILLEMQEGTNSHFERVKSEFQRRDLNAGFIQHFAARLKGFLTVG